jgi:hypothetical protein
VEVDSEVEVAEVRVEVRVEEEDEEVELVVELWLEVLVMEALEFALVVAEADEADEVMVSDDRVVETEAAELVAAPLPWKVN